MAISAADRTTLDRVQHLIEERGGWYESGVQTTIRWKSQPGWLNALTKLSFVRKLESVPAALYYEYPNLTVHQRLLSGGEARDLLERLLGENLLDLGQSEKAIALQPPCTFSLDSKARRPHSEWCSWPAEVFRIQPGQGGYQAFPPDEALIATQLPYYPSLRYLVTDLFGIESEGWMQYLQGQIVIAVPDFRARVAKLLVGATFIRIDLECVFLRPSDLVIKVYAESPTGRLVQETLKTENPFVEIPVTDKPSFVSVAIVSTETGEALDERAFREGVSWRQPNVVVEAALPDLEQILLTGESETVEFREKLDATRPQRLAKTAVAFANTKGGTVVFGVDDDHRIVGCETQGMADKITNLLRSLCEPPPSFRTRVVEQENKQLLLVEVEESPSVVHTVKELGPFIRANGSNRAPTSYELALLFGRRSSAIALPSFPLSL